MAAIRRPLAVFLCLAALVALASGKSGKAAAKAPTASAEKWWQPPDAKKMPGMPGPLSGVPPHLAGGVPAGPVPMQGIASPLVSGPMSNGASMVPPPVTPATWSGYAQHTPPIGTQHPTTTPPGGAWGAPPPTPHYDPRLARNGVGNFYNTPPSPYAAPTVMLHAAAPYTGLSQPGYAAHSALPPHGYGYGSYPQPPQQPQQLQQQQPMPQQPMPQQPMPQAGAPPRYPPQQYVMAHPPTVPHPGFPPVLLQIRTLHKQHRAHLAAVRAQLRDAKLALAALQAKEE